MAQTSAEKLEHTGPAEKERVVTVPQREQLSSTASRLCQKEQSRLFRAPYCKGGESQGEGEPHIGEKGGRQSGSMDRKGWTP